MCTYLAIYISTEDCKLVVRLQNANATDKLNKQCSRAESNVIVITSFLKMLAGTKVCLCLFVCVCVCVCVCACMCMCVYYNNIAFS